ncbi:cytochrome o ubiquinol oxidase subunit III [Blochmannia endosymbiont of Camponotus sp.]|uniref:cytochrome o ubiquinol oxidase subunit III n=1 Tax=Blochmannia endosymbiont of Camponotus sp. TaxID=700220 RepID=UPI00202560AE|nr:cytochrome o ubiquinol oxidase subunit III [Blochmannia endosymbiont of Camponotus sp.]URJ24151.1 cytochrome o ubiquinol oxidase subunit III [Blochmannia endosymbiont of Camponotus sp.]URJ25656.1 cytochrome o ubiquinol oxidase subunit III [Blochmannia endosymbiont of Camponotus sp.]URJ32646.1 cytochrome o ubiquinol oxidase subunit III [Blochmannia endosymbiont of Camponotus sp.]
MLKYNNLNIKTIFGFWLYIMSDCILFASLFAIYSVLYNNTVDCASGKDIFSLPFVFVETCCLLLSSLTHSKVMIYVEKSYTKQVNIWMGITFLLGLCFISMEIYEFYHLIKLGNNPCRSAFLSSFFTLVGTHGLHVIAGLIWIVVMIMHIVYQGLTYTNYIRMRCLSLFWHFLDIIWICVFTEVYLLGVL